MPAAQREAVTEVILRDRAYLVVADAVGVPVGTVKMWVHYGPSVAAQSDAWRLSSPNMPSHEVTVR
ncbi:hypothetical protein AB0H00_09990 [Nocardia sp. NPDC023852]|uniref:hypothetical protein n=1 Tax=Nocardia sp. NPDC023852 TaxID=3154697 RepID=UPI0033EC10E0